MTLSSSQGPSSPKVAEISSTLPLPHVHSTDTVSPAVLTFGTPYLADHYHISVSIPPLAHRRHFFATTLAPRPALRSVACRRQSVTALSSIGNRIEDINQTPSLSSLVQSDTSAASQSKKRHSARSPRLLQPKQPRLISSTRSTVVLPPSFRWFPRRLHHLPLSTKPSPENVSMLGPPCSSSDRRD
ncbi:hypothetical protein BCV69DRAFT_79420 [Microstroma glucosiphilum]|uniref:Uncharacterized protein n=1 Tax=Pseudomicrostroma glucosiphilum TaxID=1684307 RepID=A0A316U047_9BASI|nr:hypothetical protein BCV69DRAFT_79420 [Pseudomicrostroma glucosiphilum]PWN18238.1 hypothetical protein BCV69DRAFT_79420 [Pseudomicrostroma glucosiphilum]